MKEVMDAFGVVEKTTINPKTAAGVGKVQEAYVVKRSGAQKFGVALFVIFSIIGFGLFLTQFEVQFLHKDRAQTSSDTVIEQVENRKEVINLEKELHLLLSSAVAETAAAKDLEDHTQIMINKLSSHVNSQFNAQSIDFTNEFVIKMKRGLTVRTDLTAKEMGMFIPEVADVTQQCVSDFRRRIGILSHEFAENVMKILRTHTMEESKHGEMAMKRLSSLTKHLQVDQIEHVHANEELKGLIVEMRDTNLEEREIEQRIFYFFHQANEFAIKHNDSKLMTGGYEIAHISNATKEELNKMLMSNEIVDKKQVDEIEILTKLSGLVIEKKIPPPNEDFQDIDNYIKDLINPKRKHAMLELTQQILRDYEQKWREGSVNTKHFFKILEDLVISDALPATWLMPKSGKKTIFEKDTPVEAIGANNEQEDWKPLAQTSDLIKRMIKKAELGFMTKTKLYAEITELYEDGQISFPHMTRLTASLAQFAPDDKKDFESSPATKDEVKPSAPLKQP